MEKSKPLILVVSSYTRF